MKCDCCSDKFSPVVRQRKVQFVLAFLFLSVVAYTAVVLSSGTRSTVKQPEPQNTKQLRLVHVIFRHGQRTPADTYPNDKYLNHTFYPFGWGQLTNVGRQNQYKLGEFLHRRYNDFLGNLYSSATVYAQSTYPDRAFMSCALTLAGLWPTKGTQLDWNPKLSWSPIPIRSQPLNDDTLLLARKNCPRYFEELENVFAGNDVKKLLEENFILFTDLSEITGMSIKTPDDVQSLYSTLKAEDDFGLELPSWTKDYYPEKLLPLTKLSYILNAKNDELKKLKGGPLLKKLISDWSGKADNSISSKERKLFVYAGHDSTVTNLLLALGVWENQMPGYGITVICELYEDTLTKEFGVEIYLRNSTSVPPERLTIPGCTERCPLSELISLTLNVVPKNWEEECKAKNPIYVPPAPSGP